MQRIQLSLVSCLIALTGCSGAHIAVKRSSATEAVSAPALTRSHFIKPADRENMDEDLIQRVLSAPLTLEFPARVGVVVLDEPFSRRAYASQMPGDRAPQLFAREISRSSQFSMVTDMSPYLTDGQHIESLRELATRYRLKYLLVFNTRYEDRSHLNPWGWGWLTVVGIPFLPATTLQAAGIMEATLMDVRTGTFLFTAQVHMTAWQRTTPFATDAKLLALKHRTNSRAVKRLAREVITKCSLIRRETARAAARRPGPVILGGKVIEQEERAASPTATWQMHLPGA